MARDRVRPPERLRLRLERALKQPQLSLAGISSMTAQTFLLAPSSLTDEVVLWLARSPRERDQLLSLLRVWFAREEVEPAPQVLVVSEETLTDPTLPASLLKLLDGGAVWMVATTDDLRVALPPPELLRKHRIPFSTGQMVAPGSMSQTLVGLGYELQTQVASRGTFARRGGIVDVWPFDRDDPLRFDILDQRLEKITTFNWKTQRNRDELREVALTPCLLPKANRTTLAAYLSTMQERVRILLPDADELAAVDEEAPALLAQLSDFRHITFPPFAQEGAAFTMQAAPLFHRDFKQLTQFLKRHGSWTVFLLTTHADELRERCGETGATIVTVSESERDILRGFIAEKERLALLTDWELFGQDEEEVRERRTERADIVFVAEMRPGDYVVHVDHGIGRFTGTVEQEMDGETREYFILTYAEDDKLFVPVEMAEKLSKYIGMANPKLHRLSSSNWKQMKEKIREETRTTAEELLKLYAQRTKATATSFRAITPEEHALAASFPYDVTPDQQRAIEDIEHDLLQERPMDRLICGDVGFGKTEVAIRAAFKAVMNKRQVAILSPTTILTQQHFDTFRERLAQFDVTIDVLSRFRTLKQQAETLRQLALGEIDIIIGTHRLLQSDVQIKNLGLVIIDEEQRFGVQHKEQLKRMRLATHVLTLTATPIPRTLNFALAGIRDITIIETPPEGRKPIETHIEPYDDRLVERTIRRELERHGQAYFVYNEVETIELRKHALEKLLPKVRFGVAHGQMPEENLAKVMEEFDRGDIDVLVSSTIIENGLDLPNVNTLIVDRATNFGLAQLYQLRGRIGRGKHQAYAYFLYHAKKLTPEARKRLQALLEARELGSGFQLALRDLEIRGTGSILGKKQHGHVSAVGLTLYTRLLADTIREIESGVTVEPAHDVLIDLPLTIRIPKELEENEQKRLSFYQKLALEATPEGVEQRARRLFHRRSFPEPLQNLIDVLKVKLLAQPVGVTSVSFRKGLGSDLLSAGKVVITFSDPLIPSQIKALIEDNGEWQFGENHIKVSVASLGEQWIASIQRTLALVEKARHEVITAADVNGRS